MLKIRDLNKTYSNRIHALKGIDLDVPPGMFGLLGPNGAGKTTLMKILATLLEADSGTVDLSGRDLLSRPEKTRELLGYLPQEFGLYPTLTAEEMLNYFAKLKGITDGKSRRALIDTLLERVNLASVRNQRLSGFSGGMRQRLGIAQALIGEPKLIIVDEPTAGLDPEERLRFHDLLSETIRHAAVVILSTHIVSDVANLCSNMAISRNGSIRTSAAPREAVEQLRNSVWEGWLQPDNVSRLRARYQIVSSQTSDGLMRLRVISRGTRPGDEFEPVPPTLEDYYFQVVGKSERAN